MRIDPKLVVVGKRVRKNRDSGIHQLAKSIEEVGQLQPIVIDEDNNLIAGARRLRACEMLERDVDAVIAESVTDALLKLKAERDENVCRVDFTPEEAVEAGRAIESLERPKAAERKKSTQVKPGNDGKTGPSKLDAPAADKGRTDEKAAAAAGMKKDTYRKAKAVVEAAEADPSLRPVVDEMNATGKVDPAFRKVKDKPKPAPKEFDVEDDARKFRELRNKLCDNWKTDWHRKVMRQTFTQLANEV